MTRMDTKTLRELTARNLGVTFRQFSTTAALSYACDIVSRGKTIATGTAGDEAGALAIAASGILAVDDDKQRLMRENNHRLALNAATPNGANILDMSGATVATASSTGTAAAAVAAAESAYGAEVGL